jgi:hypothetical protein
MIDAVKLLPEIRPLLAEDRLNDLGPGTPNIAARARLERLEALIAPKMKNRAFASACQAGLWLFHDFLDESHVISQDLDTAEGSYWHAILHRREPDYANSKYWVRRISVHPIFGELGKEAAALAEQFGVPAGCEYLARQTTWDPLAFVDLCEAAARDKGPHQRLCQLIQRCEWDLLFHYCHDRAFSI